MRSSIFAPHSGCRTHCLPAFCRVGLGLPTFWAAFLLRAILFTWNICFPGRPFIEEIGFLPPFLLLRTGDVDFFMCIGVLPGVEHHRREGHRRGREVLHLLQIEMQFSQHLSGQRLHVPLGASRVRGDEVRDQLIGQMFLTANAMEVGGQPLEERERRFAHQAQHVILGVFGRHFKPSRGMVLQHSLQIGRAVEQVVADAAADEGLTPDGAMVYETFLTKQRTDTDRHWWVQAENVVGHINLYQYFDDEVALQKAFRCWEFIKKNLIDPQNGEWYWSIRADGTVNTGDDKAGFWKCPYHNGRMCMEIMERFS